MSNSFENAKIAEANLKFTDNGGKNGQNFVLELRLDTTNGGCYVTFNPLRLPQLLEELKLNSFNDLIGTPVQITPTDFGEECEGIRYFLSDTNDSRWFATENHTYFGCNFWRNLSTIGVNQRE